jgi:hypothetical protein
MSPIERVLKFIRQMGGSGVRIKAGRRAVCIGVYSLSHDRIYNPKVLVRLEVQP